MGKVVKFASPFVYQDNSAGGKQKEKVKEKEKSAEAPNNLVADVNVVSLDLSQLTEHAGQLITGDPNVCTKCKGIMSSLSKLQAGDKAQKWCCEFCGTENEVNLEEEEIPKSDNLDYILEPAPPKKEIDNDDTMVIFCIDTSGSMCVTCEVEVEEAPKKVASGKKPPPPKKTLQYISRLASVQGAVAAQIEALNTNSPKRKLGIVTFSDEVQILGDGSKDPVIIAGDKLSNEDILKKIGGAVEMDKGIGETKAPLLKKLNALEEQGGTALGPALLVSCAIASKRPGSKVIICTDGLANIGLGSLDLEDATDESKKAVEGFYQELAEFAKTCGVTVSLITIAGTECSIENLGKIADSTGGDVDIVDPTQMQANFSNILSNVVIATNVQVTVVAHTAFVFENGESSLSFDIGNITAASEITFHFSIRPVEIKESGLPFQVQVVYRRTSGPKCVRVITSIKPVTSDRATAESDVDVLVIGVHVSKTSANLIKEGKYNMARDNALANKEMLKRAVHTKEQQDLVSQFDSQLGVYETEMNYATNMEMLKGIDLSDKMEGIDDMYDMRSRARTDRTAAVMYNMKGSNAKACSIQ